MPLSVPERTRALKQYFGMVEDPRELEDVLSQERAAQAERDLAGYGSGVDKIISSIGGTQSQPEIYQNMQKMAGQGSDAVRNYLKQKYLREQNAEKMALEAVKAEEQSKQNELSREALDENRRANQEMRKSQLEIERARLGLEKEKAGREAIKADVGQQVLEKEEAEKVAGWDVGGGRERATNAVTRLESIKSGLADMPESSLDKIRARIGEGALSERQLKIKQDVTNAALPMLKETFGAQLSEGERKALADSFYDPRLSPKVNASNIERKIEEARADIEKKELLTTKFKEKRGGAPQDRSMQSSVSAQKIPPSVPPGMKLQFNKKTGEYRVVPK